MHNRSQLSGIWEIGTIIIIIINIIIISSSSSDNNMTWKWDD